MTLLLLSALLATVAALYVVRPIAQRRTSVLADAAPGEVLDAEARRRTTLAALKELEYDYLGGKLDDADYRAQRERLSLEALAAMRAAEAARVSFGDGASADGIASAETPSPVAVETPRVPVIAVAAMATRHRCGFENPAGSRFCAGCGKRLR